MQDEIAALKAQNSMLKDQLHRAFLQIAQIQRLNQAELQIVKHQLQSPFDIAFVEQNQTHLSIDNTLLELHSILSKPTSWPTIPQHLIQQLTELSTLSKDQLDALRISLMETIKRLEDEMERMRACEKRWEIERQALKKQLMEKCKEAKSGQKMHQQERRGSIELYCPRNYAPSKRYRATPTTVY